MAKRFTDTEKWRDDWWGSLDNDKRIIWLYLVDTCSIAGIWKKDFRGLRFNCNSQISESEFLEVFGSRLIDRGTHFFIPKFLRFQCPKGLNSNKPAILSIVKELQQNDLIEHVHKSLGNDFLIIKGTGKGKGTEKGKEKGKEEEQGSGPEKPIIPIDRHEARKQFEEKFNHAFDGATLEAYAFAFRKVDVPEQLSQFLLKCHNDSANYYHRDTGGLRSAFQHQLKTAPKKIDTSKKPEQNTSTFGAKKYK